MFSIWEWLLLIFLSSSSCKCKIILKDKALILGKEIGKLLTHFIKIGFKKSNKFPSGKTTIPFICWWSCVLVPATPLVSQNVLHSPGHYPLECKQMALDHLYPGPGWDGLTLWDQAGFSTVRLLRTSVSPCHVTIQRDNLELYIGYIGSETWLGLVN